MFITNYYFVVSLFLGQLINIFLWKHSSYMCVNLYFTYVTTHMYNKFCFMAIFCYTYVKIFMLEIFLYDLWVWKQTYFSGTFYLICVATYVYKSFRFMSPYVNNKQQLTTIAKSLQNICKWNLILFVSLCRIQRYNRYSKRR